MIQVEKINETYIRIYTNEGIEQEISEKFTFEVKNARFSPKYKAGVWDGKIRLFNLGTKTLYAGLYPILHGWAQKLGYEIKYIENDIYDKPFSFNKVTYDEIEKYIESLQITSNDEDLEARDFQVNAVVNAIQKKRITLISPTASGKSFIIYCIIRWFLDEGRKCLLIVPTTSLVEQMQSDFRDYSSKNGFDVDEETQILYSGKSKKLTTNVMITTWQSIQDEPKEFFHQFSVIIGDEGHTFKAAKLSGIMEKSVAAEVRIATTGTLDDNAVNKLVITGLFGPIMEVISTKELMDRNYVSQLAINCVLLKWKEEICKAFSKANNGKGLDYKQELDFISTNPRRNKYITKIAEKTEGNTLVLFQLVEKQGKPLNDMLQQIEGKEVFFLTGSDSVEYREEVRKRLSQIKNGIVVASYQLYSTGINVPSIENIILASPTKSRIRLLQSIGRGLRLMKGKEKCTLYDIGDSLKYKRGKNNTTLNHFISRIEIYDEQKFEYKIIEVDFG